MNLKIALVKQSFISFFCFVILSSAVLLLLLLLFIEYTGHMNFSSNDDDDEYQYCVCVRVFCCCLLIEQNMFNRFYVYFSLSLSFFLTVDVT